MKYLNVLKEKGVKSRTPTIRIFSQDYDYNSKDSYINISNFNNHAEDAALILTVRNRSEKSSLLTRQLGSTPRRGASALDFMHIYKNNPTKKEGVNKKSPQQAEVVFFKPAIGTFHHQPNCSNKEVGK